MMGSGASGQDKGISDIVVPFQIRPAGKRPTAPAVRGCSPGRARRSNPKITGEP